jgi:hypothetical protein
VSYPDPTSEAGPPRQQLSVSSWHNHGECLIQVH